MSKMALRAALAAGTVLGCAGAQSAPAMQLIYSFQFTGAANPVGGVIADAAG
jgi:hypothetical protein